MTDTLTEAQSLFHRNQLFLEQLKPIRDTLLYEFNPQKTQEKIKTYLQLPDLLPEVRTTLELAAHVAKHPEETHSLIQEKESVLLDGIPMFSTPTKTKNITHRNFI